MNNAQSLDGFYAVYCKYCGDHMLTTKEHINKEFVCGYCYQTNTHSKNHWRAILQQRESERSNNA